MHSSRKPSGPRNARNAAVVGPRPSGHNTAAGGAPPARAPASPGAPVSANIGTCAARDRAPGVASARASAAEGNLAKVLIASGCAAVVAPFTDLDVRAAPRATELFYERVLA